MNKRVPSKTGLHQTAVVMPRVDAVRMTVRAVTGFRRAAFRTLDGVTLGPSVRSVALALVRILWASAVILARDDTVLYLVARSSAGVEFCWITTLTIQSFI